MSTVFWLVKQGSSEQTNAQRHLLKRLKVSVYQQLFYQYEFFNILVGQNEGRSASQFFWSKHVMCVLVQTAESILKAFHL